LGKCVPGYFLRVFGTPVGLTWLDLGCLVLRADTRENHGGKNRVMIVAPSLFGVSWHKERWTKNKMTRFLPAGIFSVFVLVLRYCEKSSSVCVSLSVRRAGSHTGQKSKVGFRVLVFPQNYTFPTSAFSFSSNSDLAFWKSVRPSVCSIFLFFFFFYLFFFFLLNRLGKLGFEICSNINLE
jgi:hypothetical protein